MKVHGKLRLFVILLIVICNIGCDQVSKDMARRTLQSNRQVLVLDHYLTLTRIENTGAFLSLGDSLPQPMKLLFLNVLPILLLTVALAFVLLRRDLSFATILGICCIAGGGIGNLYDRSVYGSVTDFLHLDLLVFQTGIFNMADVSIMSGIFILLGERLMEYMKPAAQ